MAGPDRIEGLAIVSADGMIADARGIQPDALKLEADQRFFHARLDEATALVHGRNSGEGGPHMARRRRLTSPAPSPGSPAVHNTATPCIGTRPAPALSKPGRPPACPA